MLAWSQKPQQPVLGELSQGTIFTCAMSEDYPSVAVYGLTITARCDIAHGKAKIFSYLPVVSLKDWCHMDGAAQLAGRALRDRTSALSELLKNAGHSDSILAVQPARHVVDTLFHEGSADKKLRTRAIDIVSAIEHAKGLTLPATTEQLAALCGRFDKLRRGLFDDLLKGRLTGFYFLPAVEFNGPDDGFVVLLREVRHLPRMVARAVGAGAAIPLNEPDVAALSPHLSFSPVDFAMPIGQLPSPLIEHVMQSFTMLFSRIGLDDLPAPYLSGVWGRLAIDKQVAP